jgi:hypothetical protein
MIFVLRLIQKAIKCPNRIINTLVMEEKVYFPRKCPGLGLGPGLLGYGFKIPDRSIGVWIPAEYHANFQLSRCNRGQKIGHRRTDDKTISVEHIFQKFAFKTKSVCYVALPPPLIKICFDDFSVFLRDRELNFGYACSLSWICVSGWIDIGICKNL